MGNHKGLWLPAIALLLGLCASEIAGETIFPVPPPLPAENRYSTRGVGAGDDCVFLDSGDRVSGKILEITPGGVVRMANPHFARPLKVRLSETRRIIFAAKGAVADGPDSVVFADGSRMRGDVREISAEAVMLRTRAMGALKIDRSSVARIDFRDAKKIVLESDFGNGVSDRWTVRSGTWQVRDGKFRCISGDGRVTAALKQQGPFLYEWSVDNLHNAYSGGLIIFAKDATSTFGGDAILINPRSNHVRILSVRDNAMRQIASKSFTRRLLRANFRVAYDPASGRLRLWANGADLGTYTVNPPVKSGEFVFLYSAGVSGYQKLRITAGATGISGGRRAGDHVARFLFRNNDEITGSLSHL
ncbi:MAG: hypothetical protein QGD94_10250, partial [Planctomycetia bacterium]|nr:hypothetical protein [Planctomycetia bacterium]